MKIFLDKLILDAPRLFIKQYAYAWIIFIALWSVPPNISLAFLFLILIGMFLLRWQHIAWMNSIRVKHGSGKFYVDEPLVPWKRSAQNILVLIAIAAVISYFLNRQIGLTSAQIFLIIVGFSLLYRNSQFFGAPTTYVVTDSGIGVYYAPGHLDYRLYIKFSDITHIERCAFKKDSNWSCLARTKPGDDGLLLMPKDENFTDWIEKAYIIPQDIGKFLEQLPRGLRQGTRDHSS